MRAVVVLAILIHAQSAMAQSAVGSDDIKTVQQQLADEGYDIGDVDGQFGKKTADAIRLYQSDWKLPATGEISSELIGRLLDKHPATQPQWLKIENGDCTVWNGNPQAQETASWSGGCTGGRASGSGTLRWRFAHVSEIRESRYDGAIRDGKEDGRGVSTSPNGARYEGEWREGKRNGQGVLTTAKGGRYEGAWRDDKRDGRGTITYPNGNRYEGEFRGGERDGRGVLTLADGGRYDGEWRDGKRSGQGVLIFTNGNRFEGEWHEGEINGHGLQIFTNGDRFEGEWREGKRNGQGVLSFADGDSYEGEFRDGTPNGRGTYTRGGVGYSGNWKNGCLTTKEGAEISVVVDSEDCGF